MTRSRSARSRRLPALKPDSAEGDDAAIELEFGDRYPETRMWPRAGRLLSTERGVWADCTPCAKPG